MLDQKQILAKLRTVNDPELHVSIVDLGLIYQIRVNNQDVEILMTLTTPGCPLSAYFEQLIIDKVKEIPQVRNVEIKLTFDPPWDPSRIQSEALKAELGLL